MGLQPWVDKADVDLAADGLPQWDEQAMPEDRDRPRYIHVDLSLNRDRCGIAIVKMAGMVNVGDPRNPECVETLPHFVVETAITIQPSAAAELDIGELRSWLAQLKTYYDLNIREISYDGYQSRESIQLLRKAGIRSREVSVDRTTEAYDHLRWALYQGRVTLVDSETLFLELSQLEINEAKGKVDHPPRGSKDLADAVCGAVYAASQDRRVRAQTGPVNRNGKSTGSRTFERPSGRDRPRERERPKGRRYRRPNRKQQMHDDYRELRAKEDEAFRKRYPR